MNEPNPGWNQIKLVVAEAMELAPSERASFLELRCCGENGILREAAALVAAASAEEGLLSRRVDTWLGVTGPAASGLEGHRIGRYTLVRVLGEGASGVVYLARQDNPERTVALKVVRTPLPLVDVSGRFRLEAEALGRIRHPNVAQIYEAGVHRTETGAALPYLAMEYIDGVPITEYAAQTKASEREKVGLMIRVARAVHAAHQRAVIHRDLKPSNVLVDAEGQPRVLDFGIAKINEEGFRTRMTAAGSLLGTPGYMSPEQLTLDAADADVRTDVWSLGALLYELLAGRPPLEVSGVSPGAALRLLARAEITPIRKHLPRIGRDLECVVMTALAHDREDRYASALMFADDLDRVLAGDPISVRPPGRAEQVARFVRRHRVGVGVTTAFAVLLIAATVALAISSRRTAGERDRARAVVALLQGMIDVADPNFGDRNVTMLEGLTSLESRIEGELASQPRTEADVRSAMGSMLFRIAEYERSRMHFERAIELRKFLGDHKARLEDQVQLANSLRWLYLPREARELIERTQHEAQRRLGRSHPTTIHASEVLAGCAHDEQRLDEAEHAYREVIAQSTKAIGSTHEQTLFARSGLASVLIDAGKYAEAERELRDVLAIRSSLGQASSRELLTLRANLAMTLAEQGRLDEAIAEQRRLAKACSEQLGPVHDSTVSAWTNLAESLRRAGQSEEALAINKSVMENCAGALGWAHESTLDAVEGVAMNLVRTDHPEESAFLTERVLVEIGNAFGTNCDAYYRVLSYRAAALAGLGKPNEAIETYSAVIDHFRARYGSEHMVVLVCTNNLGLALIESGQAERAVGMYRGLLATIDGRYDSMQPVVQRNLGHALLASGQTDEARSQLTAARDASVLRGELDNAERCNRLLAEIAAKGI